MAKSKDKTTGPSVYNRWKEEHGMKPIKGIKDKFKAMQAVREKYITAKDNMETGCPWNKSVFQSTGNKGKGDGGSWFDYVEQLRKAWGMWYKPFSEDEFRSNVKSPMTTGRVESAMHKIKQMAMGFETIPGGDEDINKVKIVQEVINSLFTKKGFKYKLATWFKDALMQPIGIIRVYYMKREREVRLAKNSPKDMSKKELKELKETKGRKTFFGEKESIIEYDDIVLEPIPFQEFFPDPNARCLQGEYYRAGWVVRRRIVSESQFKAEFEGNLDCFDVDKVKPAGVFSDEELVGEFEFDKDVLEGDLIEILELENIEEDDYSIVANDVLIRGTYGSHESPLPYDHKRFTFVKIGAIEDPHRFYWRCIGDQLLAIQAEEEIMKNMLYDRFHKTIEGSWIYNKRDEKKFMESYQRTGGRFMPATVDGRPLNQVMEFIERAPVDFGAFKALEGLRQDATVATQFDPSQLALARKDMTATQSLMNKEIVDSFIVSTMESFSEGIVEVARQVAELMQQFYSVKRAKKIVGEDGKEETKSEFRKIRLEGKSIVMEGEEVTIQESDKDYEFFEVKGEYLNLEKDMDIRLSAESMRVPSKALDSQQSKEAFAQLMQFAVNPSDPEVAKQNPLPLFNAQELAKWYVNSNDLPEKILLEKDVRPEAERMQALLQNVELNKGKNVTPEPGESEGHVDVHDQFLAYWENKALNVEQEMALTPDLEDKNLMKDRKDMQKVIDAYKTHIGGDIVPKMDESQYLLSQGNMPAPPMPPGGMPGMAGPPMGGPPMPGGAPMMPGGGMPQQAPPMPPQGMPGMV